jgi:predicted Rossmann fold nucleotide-binding protein DprA/Smf involved in DNA uptake
MSAATASDTTDKVVDLLKQRKVGIKEERKALDAEEKRIEKTLDIIGGNVRRVGRPALPPGPSTNGGSKKPVAKRKRKGGTRAEQAVDLIVKAGEKGIDASRIAKVMKIKPNYLYRVLGGLESEGLVRKDGRTYYPVA